MTVLPVLSIVGARPDHHQSVLDLFADVVTADPHYAPVVTSGEVTLADWFARKTTDLALLAFEADRLVGHVAVRHNHLLPGGGRTPVTRPYEMCRLAVSPQVQHTGIATVLVRAVHRRFADALWATCHTGHGSHALMRRLGWHDHQRVGWADDPRPGMCLIAPTSLEPPYVNGGQQ